jgi:hypothetical protein
VAQRLQSSIGRRGRRLEPARLGLFRREWRHQRHRAGRGQCLPGGRHAAGGSVALDALVAGNARIAGGDISVGPATVIDGSTALSAGHVEFDGTSKGNLKAAGAHVRINGVVDGDVHVGAEFRPVR